MVDQDCELGTGPVKVVALHGWFGSATGWGYLPELVDRSTFTYAFLNYRGFGLRRAESGDRSLEEISADARALADRLGWDRFALLGHSMGGAAALRTYADAPERTTAVVGLSPVSAVGVPFDEDAWALFGGAAWDDTLRRLIIDLSTDNRLSGRWLDDMVRFSVEQSDRYAFRAHLAGWAGANFAEDMSGYGVPMKVIVGEHDPMITDRYIGSTWLSHRPGTELEVMTNSGHCPMFEVPVALITSLEHFLRGAHERRQPARVGAAVTGVAWSQGASRRPRGWPTSVLRDRRVSRRVCGRNARRAFRASGRRFCLLAR